MEKIIVICFFLSLNSFAQLSGKVIYVANFDTTRIKNDIASKKLDSVPTKKKALLKMMSNLKSVDYALEFNKIESIYKKIESMDIDDSQINFTKILAGGDKVIYTNLNSKNLIKRFNGFDKTYLMNEKIDDIKWTLVNEEKQIGTYLCYKATTTKEYKNMKGENFTKKIIAWYAPQISFRFGPSGYCDLPGLILELKEANLVYIATKISISKKNKKISKPKGGEKISKKELNKKATELYDNK